MPVDISGIVKEHSHYPSLLIEPFEESFCLAGRIEKRHGISDYHYNSRCCGLYGRPHNIRLGQCLR